MNDFERQIYTDMSATDRILIWMAKALDLKGLGDLMIELGDMPALKRALDIVGNNTASDREAEGRQQDRHLH